MTALPDPVQQSAQVCRLDVAALEAREFLREQRDDHRFAPQVRISWRK
jgi:hypothetical protein